MNTHVSSHPGREGVSPSTWDSCLPNAALLALAACFVLAGSRLPLSSPRTIGDAPYTLEQAHARRPAARPADPRRRQPRAGGRRGIRRGPQPSLSPPSTITGGRRLGVQPQRGPQPRNLRGRFAHFRVWTSPRRSIPSAGSARANARPAPGLPRPNFDADDTRQSVMTDVAVAYAESGLQPPDPEPANRVRAASSNEQESNGARVSWRSAVPTRRRCTRSLRYLHQARAQSESRRRPPISARDSELARLTGAIRDNLDAAGLGGS